MEYAVTISHLLLRFYSPVAITIYKRLHMLLISCTRAHPLKHVIFTYFRIRYARFLRNKK